MVITDIAIQKRNKDRCSVYVDGSYSFSLRLSQLLDLKVTKGMELDATGLARLQEESTHGKLYESAIRKLSRRQHSKKEIEQFLKTKQAGEEEITTIIEELCRKHYLDDAAFAENWVQHRRRSKSYSARAITYELRQKGVDPSLIESALGADQIDEKQALLSLLQKKRTHPKYLDPQKLIAFAQGKGFSYGAIREALTELEGQE